MNISILNASQIVEKYSLESKLISLGIWEDESEFCSNFEDSFIVLCDGDLNFPGNFSLDLDNWQDKDYLTSLFSSHAQISIGRKRRRISQVLL